MTGRKNILGKNKNESLASHSTYDNNNLSHNYANEDGLQCKKEYRKLGFTIRKGTLLC